MSTTAVVVCAYTLERWDDLCDSVASAADQTPAPDELWLVIDHNVELQQRCESELVSRFPQLRVLANQRKQGLSGARNTALEHVSADVVAFLDDDATAEPGWLARLLAPYADDAVIGVGGSAVPRWPENESRPVTLPCAADATHGELDWVVGCTYQGQPEQLEAVRNMMGCNMSFRTSVFPVIGGFSEDLGRVGKVPLGCEETELCIRARAEHPTSRILFEPAASVRHHVSSDRLTWRYLRRRCYAEGLSKAAVATMVDRGEALRTEATYTTQVLPRGVVRELAAAVRLRGAERTAGLAGAGAIALALGATVLGYARGRISAPRALRQAVPVLALPHPNHPEATR